jgi:hypothetical protein
MENMYIPQISWCVSSIINTGNVATISVRFYLYYTALAEDTEKPQNDLEQKKIDFFDMQNFNDRGRDSSVGMATRYGLDGPGTESQ